MIIGINLLLFTARLGPDHLPVLRDLRAAGYDGVEVPFFSGTKAQARETGRMLQGEGLRPALIGTLPDADHNPLSPEPETARRGCDHLSWLVDMAQEMGAEVIAGPFTQPLGQFTGQGLTAAEFDRMARAHQDMALRAGPGLRLAVEPLNRFECYALNTARQAAALVAAVGQPNYGFLYDTFHAHIEEDDPTAALAETLPAVAHFHVSENHRGIPGRGHAAIGPALSLLAARGYDHWISVEAFGQALPELAAATRIWRPLFPSAIDLATEARALIRAGLAT